MKILILSKNLFTNKFLYKYCFEDAVFHFKQHEREFFGLKAFLKNLPFQKNNSTNKRCQTDIKKKVWSHIS